LKALVYWCRWNNARLLLRGRSDTAVWGELALAEGARPFDFLLAESRLTIGAGAERRVIYLDEMGVERGATGEPDQ
jgi:hypothetical protein